MKKRYLVITALLTMSLLAACGKDAPADPNTPDNQVQDDQEAPTDDQNQDSQDGDDQKDDSDQGDAAPGEVNAEADGFMLPEIELLTTEFVDLKYQFAKEKYDLTWTSSDPSIVKVGKNGSKITAKKPGEATVTAQTEDGKHSFQCDVTVIKKPETVIYMTFDDGPSRYSTPKVLDILKKNKVHATFFELKPAKADHDLTQRVIDEGHCLAIHGYSHKYEKIYQSDEIYHKNLTKLQKYFYKHFGKWCTMTRFPGGSSNTVSRHYSSGIMSRVTKKIHGWGFKYQDWNVSSGDAGGAKNSNQVFKAVTGGIQKGRSNVILMHDFSGNDKTIGALQRIIDWGREKGYEFRAMTPATIEIHHGVNN